MENSKKRISPLLPHLLSEEQALCGQNSESLSWSVFHCCVGICFFVILCAFLQKEKKHVNYIIFGLIDLVYCCDQPTLFSAYFGLASWFSFALFAGFLAFHPTLPFLWNCHLSLHLHPASSLLREQLRMDARQNTTV